MAFCTKHEIEVKVGQKIPGQPDNFRTCGCFDCPERRAHQNVGVLLDPKKTSDVLRCDVDGRRI